MGALNKQRLFLMSTFIGILLLFSLFNLAVPEAARTASNVVAIAGSELSGESDDASAQAGSQGETVAARQSDTEPGLPDQDETTVQDSDTYQDDELLEQHPDTEPGLSDQDEPSTHDAPLNDELLEQHPDETFTQDPLPADDLLEQQPELYSVLANDTDTMLTISGDGVAGERKFTRKELSNMKQTQLLYSAINTWPSKKWYAGRGVQLRELLKQAGMNDRATMVRFTSRDGFTQTVTVAELLETPRYCFPEFKPDDGDGDGHVPGSTEDAYQVETILALVSVEGYNAPEYMNDLNALLLMVGQRAVTEQTGELFVKNVTKIEVLTGMPSQWESPQAAADPVPDPVTGRVMVGAKVQLTSENNDNDKVHYTTDGSDPDIRSAMYNYVAKRWWSSRGEKMVTSINKPIEITQDTTIKAITIGPGKRDSEVVEFQYIVNRVELQADPAPVELFTDDDEHTAQLHVTAEPENAVLSFKSGDESIASVNSEGLVTALKSGGTKITVTASLEGYLSAVTEIPIQVNHPPVWPAGTELTGQIAGEDVHLSWPAAISKKGVADYRIYQNGKLLESVKETEYTVSGLTAMGSYRFSVRAADAAGNESDAISNEIKVATAWPAGTVLTATVNGSSVFLKWPLADENKNVTVYRIYKNNELVASVEETEYTVTVSTNGSYCFSVQAVDAAGNESEAISADVKIATGSGLKYEDLPDTTVVLRVSGSGVANAKEFTKGEIEGMTKTRVVYSAINTWPSKKWYVGEGVRLRDVLNQAGMSSSATMLRLTAKDGFTQTMMVEELLETPRYCFPQFKSGSGDGDGHIPGSSAGKRPVEPILATKSAEGTSDPGYMNDVNALLLMIGQRAVTEQTGEMFIKNLSSIEVLTSDPPQWSEPQADPAGGNVVMGTKVKLTSENNDNDKVYYTTDGTAPNMDSAMYNYVANRWWASRGSETVASINKPVEITKDTVIKAVTIGPGKRDSEVVEFAYKVVNGPVTVSGPITPENGGKVSIEGEVGVDVPPGAVNNSVELKIERQTEKHPSVPAGLKLLSDIYQFTVVGSESGYKFNKYVTVTLFFDPETIGPDEAPLIYYYDEYKDEWIQLGGVVTDNYVTVGVDHFTMFALMIAQPNKATAWIKPEEGGIVSLNDEAILEIPAGALEGNKEIEITIERLTGAPAVPAGWRMVGAAYQFSVDNQTEYKFNKNVTIKLLYSQGTQDEEEYPAMYYYDTAQEEWIILENTLSDNYIVVEVDHFTMFALMRPVPLVVMPLTDISGHWAEDAITQLVAQEAISGYADDTFLPENPITRGEFATVLVKAFNLTGQGRQPFADTAGHQAAEPIGLAVVFGLINGYDDNKFRPDNLVSREELAMMSVRAAKMTQEKEELTFVDSDDISPWAREAVATAFKYGIVKGDPENTFRPQDSATRAEAVQVVFNALQKAN